MFDNSVQLFYTLPAELQSLVLGYIDKTCLSTMFDLDGLVQEKAIDQKVESVLDDIQENPFLECRHRALVAKHTQSPLIFSNLLSQSSIDLAEINYLMAHGIKLSPRNLTISLFLECMEVPPACLLQYLCYLQTMPQSVTLRLNARSKAGLPNKVQKALLFVASAGLQVSELAVRHVCSGSCSEIAQPNTIKQATVRPRESGDSSPDFPIVSSSANSPIGLEDPSPSFSENLVSLQLHLFTPNCLPQLLKCHTGQALCSVDLAYNHITEWHMNQICFPSTLRALNLSNNQLHIMSNETLTLSNLPCLEQLDISNNNLMRIEPFYHIYTSSLRRLDLSGNLLQDYSALFKSPFFEGLRELDLSRNLLESLTEIPKAVTTVGLEGNYFQASVKRAYDE